MALNVNIELTDRCNLRCVMCSQAHRPLAHGERPRFMERETWRASLLALEGLPDEVHLCPHWLGEPTLHPRFDDLAEMAFSLNTGNRLFRTFKLHTNGVLFGGRRAGLLVDLALRSDQAADSFRTVHFSVDAATRDVYRRVKGADRYELVRENILGFLEARRRRGSERPVACVAFVVQPENWYEAAAFVETWARAFERYGRAWTLASDWPDDRGDAIYLRALNCADQRAAETLHAKVCAALGLGGGAEGFRGRASF